MSESDVKGTFWASSRLLLFALAIALGIGALVAHQLLASRASIWQRAQADNANLLFTVSHALEATLRAADQAALHVIHHLEDGTHDMLSHAVPHANRFGGQPQGGLGVLLVLDADGSVTHASDPFPEGEWNFADRSYFTAHMSDPRRGLYISQPFISRFDGSASLALSRRWNQPDGRFGGVVVQTLKLDRLKELFSAIELGADSGINLFLLDGTIVMRFPYTGSLTGKTLAGTANFERFLKEREGSFTGIAALDGVERLYTFRALGDYPLLINTAQSTDSILGGWRRQAVSLGLATSFLMLACLGLALVAERELRAHRATSRRLQRAEHELRTVLDSLPARVAYWDDSMRNRFSNLAHQKWHRVTAKQLKGRHMAEILGPANFEQIQPYVREALKGRTQVFEQALRDQDDRLEHSVAILTPDLVQGEVKGFFVLINDITDRKVAEDKLFQEKERFRVTLESIRDGVITTDEAGCVTYQNRAAELMTGWPLSRAQGRPIEDVVNMQKLADGAVLVHNPVRVALAERGVVQSDGEHVLVGRSGERTHIEDTAAPISDEKGELAGAILVFHEVSQARAMAHKMAHLAQHDALTGLPNRRRLAQLSEQAMARAARDGRKLALLYLDLDGFKAVNDSLGHAVGDLLLIEVTKRLSDTLRKGDTLCRKGGDEFVVLMDGIRDEAEARAAAERLIAACRRPVVLEGQPLVVTVSIGIGIYPDDSTSFDQLVRVADAAMYQAKQAGRNRHAIAANWEA